MSTREAFNWVYDHYVNQVRPSYGYVTEVPLYRQKPWLTATGQPVDGVIAIDVPGLAPLLRATGPVQVAGIAQPVTADNVTKLLLHDLYGQYPIEAEAARQQRLADVASAADCGARCIRPMAWPPLPLPPAPASRPPYWRSSK